MRADPPEFGGGAFAFGALDDGEGSAYSTAGAADAAGVDE